jgi:DNA modification methylase
MMPNFKILQGDCRQTLKSLPDESVNCCVTSPPYFGLRDYGCEDQIGLEQTPDAFVEELVEVFREVKRVLRDDGTLWLNLGDSYASNPASGGSQSSKMTGGEHKRTPTSPYRRPEGLKHKDLIGIPWRVAFALQADGWYLRQDIIWHKPNPMPESVQDRCTKAHEYIFLLSKSARYFYDIKSVMEPVASGTVARLSQPTISQQVGSDRVPGKTNGNMKAVGSTETRNRRSVWTVTTKPYSGAHFATFPPDLIEPCILAGSPRGGFVLDPFGGSGTTAQVAMENNRSAILCELNPEYVGLINERLHGITPTLF